MIAAIATSAALLAGSALAGGLGSAVVVNNCGYDVHLCNTPASGGGQSQVDRVLKTGDSYSQQWTQLTNTMGWSIKLSKDTSMGSNIMQYEYTYHGDNIIWYDMSEVDGNPWNGNFEITADSDGSKCQPRQVAYRFATDDAYGMQDCPSDSTITVTLCSAENATTPDAPASYAAPSSAPIQYQSKAAASTFQTVSTKAAAPAKSSKAPAPTSQAAAAPVVNFDPATTEVAIITETEWVTLDTTMTAWRPYHIGGWKRHQHHARHAHN